MNRSFFSRLSAGFSAFKESYTTSSLQQLEDQEFTSFEARRMRYEMYWAFYESTVYRNIHAWSHRMKTDYALYRWIRAVYNPTYRLGEFWKTHVWGGFLDPLAGDGKFHPSSIPIRIPIENEKNDEALRAGISAVWLSSNFAVKKDLWSLYGSILGDLPVLVVDDPSKKDIYLEAIHPGTLQEIDLDAKGNVRGYTIVERRPDPESESRWATYMEEATREGDNVVYKTFRDGAPYAWNENHGEEWKIPYGFVPMVLIKHNEVGLQFGWSEIHAGRLKFMELDDLASKLHDHVRKNVDPAWLFSGVSKSKDTNTQERPRSDVSNDQPEPEREQIPAIYATNPQAKASPLVVTDLDIEAVSGVLENMFEELEKDYPELTWDEQAAVATNSSRAIRVARQKVENKVIGRRANYDNALVRVMQMAVSIGGMRNYDEYKGFNLDSFEAGDLSFHIDNRPVFGKDPLDDLEVDEKFWMVADFAVPYLGLEYYLERAGWAEEDRKRAVTGYEENQEKGILPVAQAGGFGANGKEKEGEKQTQP